MKERRHRGVAVRLISTGVFCFAFALGAFATPPASGSISVKSATAEHAAHDVQNVDWPAIPA